MLLLSYILYSRCTQSDVVKERKVDWTCTCGGDEKCVQNVNKEPEMKRPLVYLRRLS